MQMVRVTAALTVAVTIHLISGQQFALKAGLGLLSLMACQVDLVIGAVSSTKVNRVTADLVFCVILNGLISLMAALPFYIMFNFFVSNYVSESIIISFAGLVYIL